MFILVLIIAVTLIWIAWSLARVAFLLEKMERPIGPVAPEIKSHVHPDLEIHEVLMDRAEAIRQLTILQDGDDPEADHYNADEVLCDFLEALGYGDVVDAFKMVEKYYA